MTDAKNNKRVLIAVPTYQFAQPETMESIYAMDTPKNVETALRFVTGYTVAQARNLCVEISLAEGYDYTLFVDSDIILPKDALVRLLACDAPIATGWYNKKIPGKQVTEIYAPTPDGTTPMANVLAESLPQDTRSEITGCGFGCTLVRNEVFKAIGVACWFEYVERPGQICSEDLTFCIKARNLRYAIVCDTGLHCQHKGTFMY